jgi:flavin-dependent thymidylate synthase
MSTGKEVNKWADEYMFEAEKSIPVPTVYLLAASADPLGQIAACAKMYKGEVVRDLADVTDEERMEYLVEMQKTKLKMPLEAVSMHFMIEGVTRGFTHQMVRQRTAAYAQESTRFAVKEDLSTATALPPSLMGTTGAAGSDPITEDEYDRLPDQEKMRYIWDGAVEHVGQAYMHLVNMGMPAEDARGLMPTNITTRLNYTTNLRGLLDHAGNRLCTQAQFEWRTEFAQVAQAMRNYGPMNEYKVNGPDGIYSHSKSSAWQWRAIADLLQPVCYQTGKCEFKADFDRKCTIRERVDAFAEHNVPSSEWGKGAEVGDPMYAGERRLLPIHPAEWLADPAAAR